MLTKVREPQVYSVSTGRPPRSSLKNHFKSSVHPCICVQMLLPAKSHTTASHCLIRNRRGKEAMGNEVLSFSSEIQKRLQETSNDCKLIMNDLAQYGKAYIGDRIFE